MRAVLLVLAAVAAADAANAQPHVDRIFVNARIWTGDETKPTAEALAIAGDRIAAVGTNAEIRKLASPSTAVVDLKGLRMVPGFQDSHLHFPGPSVNEVNLEAATNVDELKHLIGEFAKTHPDQRWITGRGWGYSAFPNQQAHKKYLDAVVADRPVYLTERDGHMGLANSKALELAGITKASGTVTNGRIVREPSEEPTGELQEAAQMLVRRLIPRQTDDEIYQALLTHMNEAAACGITSVQNASWTAQAHPLYLRALAAGELKIRFRFALPMIPKESSSYPRNHTLEAPVGAEELAPYKQLGQTFRGPLLEFGAIKGMLDGTVDAKTAAMFEPYVGSSTSGIPFWESEELNQTVALYDREGFQILLHAIGDRAIRQALDAFEFAAKQNGTSGRRHRVEHVEVPALADLPRFQQLGVIASTQALFASPDATTLDNYAPLLGPERASRSNSFKLFDDAGAVQAFGSDWSVFPFAPLAGIHAAVTRRTPEGTPVGGWYPAGRITVEAALRHYTRDGAYANFAEQIRGTLTPGKLADLVVLSRDILSIDPMEIVKTKVMLTVMGGRDTYRDRGL